MFNLRHLITCTSAAMSSKRFSALTADDQQKEDDTATRTNAGHGSCQAFEPCLFSVGDATSLAIMAQCVP